MYIRQGSEITTRKTSAKFLEIKNFRSLEWFRPPCQDFQSCYGSILGTYKVERRLLLLNLGSVKTRSDLLRHTNLTCNDINPDNQYSGHKPNEKVHKEILRSPFFKAYDGTIITTNLIDKQLLDDMEGPEEIVLFMPRCANAISLTSIIKS